MKKSILFILISTIISHASAQDIGNKSLLGATYQACQLDEEEDCADDQTKVKPDHISDVMVVREPIPVPVNGNTFYDKDNFQRLPTRNGNITDLLKTNPAVRFNDSKNSSLNQGSIDAQNISFHGSSPYQNLFLIDGISATNRVNPANSNMIDNGTNIAGNSQGYFLDISLLDSVRVFDSNVPVEFGEFNGGVVDAQLGRFSGDDKVKFSVRTTQSNWNKQHVKDSEESEYQHGGNGTTKVYSPDYKKYFYSLSIDKQLTDKVGFIAGLSHRESRVIRSVNMSGQKGKNTDDINTLLAKISWFATDTITNDFSIKFNQVNHEIQSYSGFNYGDTSRDMGSKSYGAAWQYEQLFTNGKLKFNLGWDHIESYTKSNSSSYYTENPCVSIPGVTGRCSMGGQGHISEGTDTITTKTRWDFNSFNTGEVQHDLYIGFDYSHINGKTERHNESETYLINTSTNVVSAHNKYRTGKGTLSINHYAAYLSDTLTYDRFSLTPGVRYDYDSFLDNHNLAPRIRAEYDVFADSNTVLTSGYNRYYGTSFMGSRLRDIRSSWRYNAITGVPAGVTATDYKDLKTPYSNEWTLGAQQKVDNFIFGLNYVHRTNRDQITLSKNKKNYLNRGYISADSYNFSIKLMEAWRVKSMEINPQFVLSYMDINGNHLHDTGYDDNGPSYSDEVIYNGKLMDRNDVPSAEYNIPWIATLNLDFSWPDYNVILGNTFTYQSKQSTRVTLSPSDPGYDSSYPLNNPPQWKDVDLSGNVTWDMHASWQPHFIKNQPLMLSLDLLNVLDRKNTVPTSYVTTMSKNTSSYGPGRQLWLQVDYTF